MRYYLAATYARSMALGNPGESIYIDFKQKIKNQKEWESLAIEELNKYFISHKESLAAKANPQNSEVTFLIRKSEKKIENNDKYHILCLF